MIETVIYAILAFVVVLYLAALYLRDASIMDIFWGIGIILASAQSLYIGFYNNLGIAFPKLIVGALVIVWGIRLALHIGLRHSGEDPRYAHLRIEWGRAYWWKSLINIYIGQGVLMLLVALPVILLNLSSVGKYDSRLLWVGVGIWIIGFLLETIADLQLTLFRRNLINKGKILMSGLWKYSRHPNYFGEALLWWGLFVVALAAGSVAWYWLIIGPIVITILLRYVTGVPIAEKQLSRNPHFATYAGKTNIFVPWFSKK